MNTRQSLQDEGLDPNALKIRDQRSTVKGWRRTRTFLANLESATIEGLLKVETINDPTG